MRFGRANDRLMDQNILAVRASAITLPVMMFTLNAGVVAAVWFGGLRVNAGGLQVGQLVAFINYLTQTLMSLMMISMAVVRVARAEASAERIQEVLDNVADVQGATAAQPLGAPRGRIAFENVSFSYPGDHRDPVLRQISFAVEPGQTVALLGATGAGKSSLVNLIPRFYDVTGGRVTIDGVDVRAIDEAELRKTVGVALQETVLFSGSIRDNIRYGRPDASDEEVVAAARMARAHDFISRFPDGYSSIVGQRGVNLSGGQKQRIAIARALLARPAVLVLDDSTSAVDVETEARIQEALAAQAHTQTRVVVAQRISTVLSADVILVLDDGRIAAEGCHEQLLVSSPLYREIYRSQLDNGALIHE
jgi:ATP-binding cassette subfamily B protein